MAAVPPVFSENGRISSVFFVLLLATTTRAAPFTFDPTSPQPSAGRTNLGESPTTVQITDTPVSTHETSARTAETPMANAVTTSVVPDLPMRSEDISADDTSEDETPSSVDLLSTGRQCVNAFRYTITQTNDAFNRLCSTEWCSDNWFDDVTSCRNTVNRTSSEYPGLPSVVDALDIYAKKTVFTSLMAIYNTTFQYTVGLEKLMESELAEVCGDDVSCGADCSHPDGVPQELSNYCTLRGVYLAYQDLLAENLKPMVIRLHGSVSEPRMTMPVSVATSSVWNDLMVLAAASRQMTDAMSIMTQAVVMQL